MYKTAKKLYGFIVRLINFCIGMRIRNFSKRAEKLLPYYQDDISVKWLRARERYNQNHDITIFTKTEKSIDSKCSYIINEPGDHPAAVIYKDKDDRIAKYTKRIMELDNSRRECRFFSLEEYQSGCRERFKDGEILIPAMDRESIFDFLTVVRKNGDWNRLFVPQYGVIVGITGWQYFDMFSPVENEVFIDAGAFDGQTESEILKWGGGCIKKIYAFEAEPANFEQCRTYYEKNGLTEKVQFIEKGLWNKQETMKIGNGESSAGSHISSDGKSVIEVTTLDSEVGDEKVTFIKMDIEGSELNALKGAKETIVKNRPRLAICIYHKPEDICEIPEYILSIVPEYRFWIRHYATNEWETVLYAQCP